MSEKVDTIAETEEGKDTVSPLPSGVKNIPPKLGAVAYQRRHSTVNVFDAKFKSQSVISKETWRSAGIVCTLGPGSQDIKTMENLLEAGLDVARFNFSHGEHSYHKKLMNTVRAAAKKCNRMVAVALDTKGPEIRTGTFVDDKEVELKKGAKVVVTVDEKFAKAGTVEKFWVTYSDLPKSIKKGSTIFVDDGLIALEVRFR